MPCRVPDGSNPHQCNKKVARGGNRPDGLDHVWPQEGHLLISRCEVYCWYCWESKGKTDKWKFPWYLRRHVQSVHAGRTHPKMTCSNGWAESQTGNRKPWREEGVVAPMGRTAAPKTPKAKASQTSKPPKIPERQQKRQVQKKKRSSNMAALNNKTHDTTSTPSPPALTDDTPFSTPGGQLPLPNDLAYTPGSFTMTGDNEGMPFTLGSNGMTTMFGGDLASAYDEHFDEDMFGNCQPVGGLGVDFGPPRLKSSMMAFGDAMKGLDLASNVLPTTESFTSIDTVSSTPDALEPAWNQSLPYFTEGPIVEPTTSQSSMLERSWMHEQLCRTDGTVVEPVNPPAAAADAIFYDLNDKIFDRIAMGEVSEGQALYVLQSYTERFRNGKK